MTENLYIFFLPQLRGWVGLGCETSALVGTMEGFGGETGDVSLYFAGGGSAVCVWSG
jgi:hypothetical protein